MRELARRLGMAALAAACAGPVAGALPPAADGQPRRYVFAVDEDALAGAPDASGLNRPLDAGSRLVVRGAHFYQVGPDGLADTADDVRTRLFGVNLSFSANFPPPGEARAYARRLRKLGFNAVRLHHLDSLPGTQVDPPDSILTPGPYPSFSPQAVERLRAFVRALAQEGIYVNLNLRVGYRFRPEVDGLPALAARPPVGAPLHAYHPRMIALQQDYARQLLRALELRGSPALAMVEISNESSLLAAWQRREWRDAVPPGYAQILQDKWQDWLAARYGSPEAACAAWRQACPAAGQPVPMVAPDGADAAGAAGTLLGQMAGEVSARLRRLAGRVLDGAGAAADGPARRVEDFLRFLADTDRAYYEAMRAVVHQETDARVPVTGTQMVYGGLLNLDSQAGMDYLDEHFYVAHPEFPSGWNMTDWRVPDQSLTGGQLDRLLALSLRRDVRRPFVLSEFNQPFPHPRSAEALPLAALVAALQDWDGLFFFDYATGPRPEPAPNLFSLSGDWGKYALVGQSAALFRAGLPAPPAQSLVLRPPPAVRAAATAADAYDGLERLVAGRYGVTPAMGWRAKLGVDAREGAAGNEPGGGAAGSPGASAGAPGASAAEIDGAPPDARAPYATPDGSLAYDPAAQRAVLDIAQAWGAFGRVAGLRAQAGPLWLDAPAGGPEVPAALLLTPLDGLPLARSQRLLLSVGSATRGTQPGSIPARPQEPAPYPGRADWLTFEPAAGSGAPSGPFDAHPPAWLAQPALRLGWRASASAAPAVFPLDGKGARMAALPPACTAREGELAYAALDCPDAPPSPWYEIVLPAAQRSAAKAEAPATAAAAAATAATMPEAAR